MDMISELLEKLGISLRAIAPLLDTDHTQLSRFENHTRNLPLVSNAPLAQLIAMTHKAPPLQVPQPTVEEKVEVQKRADWCRAMLQPQQKKLAVMQKNYQQASLMLLVLEQYTLSVETLTPKMKSWVEGRQYAANRKIEENGWQAQQLVLQKIHALEQESMFWEKAIDAEKS